MELRFRFDLLSQFRSVCLTPLRKCLPKSCHVLKRAKRPCLGLPVPKGHIGKHHDIENIQNCLAEARHSKQAAGCQVAQSWASGSSWCLEGSKAQGCSGFKPQTSPQVPLPPPLPHPPGFSQPLKPPPTNTLSLSQSLTLFPPLLLPLPISHPLIFCPPLHNLHLSSQILPAFTVFKRTF